MKELIVSSWQQQSMKVTIVHYICGQSFFVELPITATVLDLKARICAQLGISIERQDLFFNGRRLYTDWRPLQGYYGVVDGDAVVLDLKACVYIMKPNDPGSRYALMINLDIQVRCLKELIRLNFVPMPVERMRLRVSNRPCYISDDYAKLGACGIQEATHIHVFSDN